MILQKEILVVIVARNPFSALSAVRAAGEKGYIVDLVAISRKQQAFNAVFQSKYVRNFTEIVSIYQEDDGERNLLDELLKYDKQQYAQMVLVPTDNYTAYVVDSNREQLQDHYVMPFVKRDRTDSFAYYMDKTVQSRLAMECGLNVPKEWIISLEEQIVIPEDMIYPCFCKSLASTNKNEQRKDECSDEEELKEYLYEMRRRPKRPFTAVLVQEFLNIDREFSVAGVCMGDNVYMPAMIEKTNFAEDDEDQILEGKIVPVNKLNHVKTSIENLLKKLNYHGLFEIELNVVNDEIYFNDLNLCGSMVNDAYRMCGINFYQILIESLLQYKLAIEDTASVEKVKRFVDGQVLWNDYVNGFVTKEEQEEMLQFADFVLVFDENDPTPNDILKKIIVRQEKRGRISGIKRIIKSFIKAYIFPPLRKVKHILLRYPQTKRKNRRKDDSEYPRVMIVGRNYCSNLCMAKAVGEAGYEVEILRIFQRKPRRKNIMKKLKPDAYSKYVKAYHVCISRRSIRIANRLKGLRDENRKMLLIPTDDFVAHITDAYYEDLKEFYLLPNINDLEGEINRMMSKDVQKELALKAGLPVLGSCVIRTENGQFDIPESVKYPCFIKPNISKNGSKTKMRKCDTEDELRCALEEISETRDVEMLVEDYVEIAKEYSLLGISTKEGTIGPGFFVAEEGGEKEHRGVAVIGKVLPCSKMQNLIDDLIRFVDSINYEGLYDIDLIETVDGSVYFVELNVRFGGSGHAITESGVNLPGMFADYMLKNKPIDMNCILEDSGKRFISEKILIEEFAKGRLTWSRVREHMNSVEIHFIKDKKDFKPYKHFRKFYMGAWLLGVVRKARGEE